MALINTVPLCCRVYAEDWSKELGVAVGLMLQRDLASTLLELCHASVKYCPKHG